MRKGCILMGSWLGFLALAGCTSGGETARNSGGGSGEGPTTEPKPAEEAVPEQVKAIERWIDEPSALIADEIEIYVSRNYEWDVSLTGDEVSPQRAEGSEQVSSAEGQARASFRNLDLRAHQRIIFRKSGFDVVPFIKITARGHAAYATEGRGGSPAVKRARTIRIQNADIQFEGEQPVASR